MSDLVRSKNTKTKEYHRFLDEAGDTTFYGKGKIPIIGNEGVSKTFILGMVKINQPLEDIRNNIIELQNEIASSAYYCNIPSVVKRIEKGGFYFHAKDDLPEIRKEFFDYLLKIDFSFEAIVARKIVEIYERKHNGKGNEFYADLLSHLLKDKLEKYPKLILNIAQRKNSTEYNNLQLALHKAVVRLQKNPHTETTSYKVNFNVQSFTAEPLFAIADYCCWAIQRIFEKGEARFYEYLQNKMKLVVDLYDSSNYAENRNYYTFENQLVVKNKISPHLP